MKKKLVWFLCRIGLYRIAYKISPSLATAWKWEKAIKQISRGCEAAIAEFNGFAKAIKKATESINNNTRT